MNNREQSKSDLQLTYEKAYDPGTDYQILDTIISTIDRILNVQHNLQEPIHCQENH